MFLFKTVNKAYTIPSHYLSIDQRKNVVDLESTVPTPPKHPIEYPTGHCEGGEKKIWEGLGRVFLRMQMSGKFENRFNRIYFLVFLEKCPEFSPKFKCQRNLWWWRRMEGINIELLKPKSGCRRRKRFFRRLELEIKLVFPPNSNPLLPKLSSSPSHLNGKKSYVR